VDVIWYDRGGWWESEPSSVGTFYIYKHMFPGTPHTGQYEVRHGGGHSGLGAPGYHIGQHYDFEQAKKIAERKAWRLSMGSRMDVPKDYPSLKLKRFFWPISEDTTRAGLALVERGGKRYAQVVGVGRVEGDTLRTDVYAEMKIPKEK
jgi:hypothetical protein